MRKLLVAILFLGALNAHAEDCNIVYGMNPIYMPYEWLNAQGQPEGMAIDLLKAMAQAAECSYEILAISYEERLAGLENGSIDMVSLSPVQRTSSFAVAIPTSMVFYRYIFSRLDSDFMHNLGDLRNTTVLVTENTYSHHKLLEIAAEYNIHVVAYETSTYAIKRFSEGEGDAFISTLELALNSANDAGVTNLRSDGFPIFPAVYEFTMNKNNAELYVRINEAMEQIKQSGEYYEIIKKWQMREPSPTWYGYIPVLIVLVIAAAVVTLIWNKMLHKQVQKKTESLSSLSALFQMVLDSMPENIYLINSNCDISWTNSRSQHSYPIESLSKEICNAIVDKRGFDFTRLSPDAHTWRIVGVVIDNDENKLLVIMSDMSENVKLRDEALMAARLAAIGEMAASMVHEINNPTGLIILNSDYLKQTSSKITAFINDHINEIELEKYTDMDWQTLKAQSAAASSIVDASLTRIKKTIDELKEFSVTKSNRYEILDIRKPASDALRFTSFFVNKHTNFFVYKADDDIPLVYGNALHIEQAVINLIQNACYALTDKAQKIQCSITVTDDRRHIKLSVSDEGCGIDEETVGKVWDPFFTTRKEQGGTGLGLSVISRVVREHGGYYEVASSSGKGAVFTLFFPVKD